MCVVFYTVSLTEIHIVLIFDFRQNLTWWTKCLPKIGRAALDRTMPSRIIASGITFHSLLESKHPSNHVHQHWYQRLRPHRPVSLTQRKNRAYILCRDESSSKQLRRCNSTAWMVHCWVPIIADKPSTAHQRHIVGSKVEVRMNQRECPSVVAILHGRIVRGS